MNSAISAEIVSGAGGLREVNVLPASNGQPVVRVRSGAILHTGIARRTTIVRGILHVVEVRPAIGKQCYGVGNNSSGRVVDVCRSGAWSRPPGISGIGIIVPHYVNGVLRGDGKATLPVIRTHREISQVAVYQPQNVPRTRDLVLPATI